MYWLIAAVLVLILSVFLNCVSCEIEIKDEENRVYVVFVDSSKKPPQYSDAEEWYIAILKSLKGTPHIIYVYKIFHGFAAKLNKEQVQGLKARPEILLLIPDRSYH